MFFNIQSGVIEKELEASNHREAAEMFYHSTSDLSELISVSKKTQKKIHPAKYFLTSTIKNALPKFQLIGN